MKPPESDEMRDFFQRDAVGRYLGAELLTLGPGFATVVMEVQSTHLNAYGTVHGGVIFALADIAFGLAGNSEGIPAVAINVTISFMKSIRTGALYAEAKEYSSHPKLASYQVKVTDQKGEQIALFHGMAYRKNRSPERPQETNTNDLRSSFR
jgi:acyl-CoA thioesterase